MKKLHGSPRADDARMAKRPAAGAYDFPIHEILHQVRQVL